MVNIEQPRPVRDRVVGTLHQRTQDVDRRCDELELKKRLMAVG
jgi:hypothetical protein